MSVPTQSFKSVMWAIGRRLKMDPTANGAEDAWTLASVELTEMLNSIYKLAWEYWPWPDATEIREETPEAHPTVANALYVPRSTVTRTLMDVFQVWDRDPRADQSARPVGFREAADGLYFFSTASVWVEYRGACPEFTSTAWVTATTYAVNELVYFTDGHVYRCLIAHTSGVFATDLAANKWVVVTLLACLAEPTKQGVIGLWREADGQSGRAEMLQGKMLDLMQAEMRRIRKTAGGSLRTQNE